MQPRLAAPLRIERFEPALRKHIVVRNFTRLKSFCRMEQTSKKRMENSIDSGRSPILRAENLAGEYTEWLERTLRIAPKRNKACQQSVWPHRDRPARINGKNDACSGMKICKCHDEKLLSFPKSPHENEYLCHRSGKEWIVRRKSH